MQKQLPANRLRELRVAAGLKYYDIAAKVRIDPSTVWRWETGRSPVPDRVKLELADLYEVDVEYLMGWDRVAA